MKNVFVKTGAIALCSLLMSAGVASAQSLQTDPAAAAAAAAAVTALSGTNGLGVGATQTQQAALGVSLTAAPSVPAGASQVVLAAITFDASQAGQNVAIQSIPVAAQYQGVPAGALTSCSIQNVAALGTPLSALSAGGMLGQTGSVFAFPTPVMIPAGATARYALVCSVSPATPVGGKVMLGINPTAIQAMGGNGTPIAVGALPSTNGTNPLVGVVTITAPVGSTPSVPNTGGSTGPTYPHVPNTGVGGDMVATLLILALSLLAAYAGAVTVRRMEMRV